VTPSSLFTAAAISSFVFTSICRCCFKPTIVRVRLLPAVFLALPSTIDQLFGQSHKKTRKLSSASRSFYTLAISSFVFTSICRCCFKPTIVCVRLLPAVFLALPSTIDQLFGQSHKITRKLSSASRSFYTLAGRYRGNIKSTELFDF